MIESYRMGCSGRLRIPETESALMDGCYFEQSEDRKHTLAEVIERYIADYQTDGIKRHHLKYWKD